MKNSIKMSYKTREGCMKVIAVLLAVILLSSFCAALISSDFASVKISHLKIDARGAELDLDLYAPAGVSDSDRLPCVVLAHGRGATKNVVRGVAEELSRRGFVVLNVNSYGMGLSEQPIRDEGGNGAEQFNFGVGSYGLTDAIAFARTLHYVDQSRIALYGHSYGSSRSANAAIADCGYYTFNDIMINVLCDTFGQTFTEEEITQDADALAAARLNKDQLAFYETIRAQEQAQYNTHINTIVLTGSGGGPAPATVSVGGYEVIRNCQVNVTFINGKYDSLGPGAMWNEDGTTVILGVPTKMETWYKVNEDGTAFEEIGALGNVSVTGNEALAEAIASRTARIVCYNSESHSKNYFSSATAGDAVRILSQTLSYNNGELANPATVPLDAGNTIWWLRAVFNLIAMLAMLTLIFPVASLLLQSNFFAAAVVPKQESRLGKTGKKEYWAFAAITVVATILCLLKANSGGPVWANPFGTRILDNTLRLVTTSAIAVWFVVWLTVASLIILVIKALLNKKRFGDAGIRELNPLPKAGSILKALLIAVIIIMISNSLLVMIGRLFNQDFRFWQSQFTDMRIGDWLVALPYVIMFTACYFVLGLAINYGARTDLSERKEMALTIIVNSFGVWALCLFCYVMWFVNWKGAAISDFTLSYSMLLFVPVTVYVSRKLYKMTNSVWLGAFINAMLLSWTLVCSAGIADKYYGQSIIAILFGA